MIKHLIAILLFIFFASCQLKEDSVSRELLLIKNDTLSIVQIDSILNVNEISESEWDIHKIDSINEAYVPYNLYDCFMQINLFIPDSLKLEMIKSEL